LASSHIKTNFTHLELRLMQTNFCNITGLDINVYPIPVKIDVGQLDLVSQLSDGTSEKKWLSYLLKVIFYVDCFVLFTDLNFVNNYFNVLKNIGFHWSTLSLITTVNQEIFRTYTWSVSFQWFERQLTLFNYNEIEIDLFIVFLSPMQ
jgi:hypothetical protein